MGDALKLLSGLNIVLVALMLANQEDMTDGMRMLLLLNTILIGIGILFNI